MAASVAAVRAHANHAAGLATVSAVAAGDWDAANPRSSPPPSDAASDVRLAAGGGLAPLRRPAVGERACGCVDGGGGGGSGCGCGGGGCPLCAADAEAPVSGAALPPSGALTPATPPPLVAAAPPLPVGVPELSAALAAGLLRDSEDHAGARAAAAAAASKGARGGKGCSVM
jgi:hypothetical protein